MTDACRSFLRWTDCLLDPSATPGEQREAAAGWCDWALERLGVDERRMGLADEGFFRPTPGPAGQAISPLGAARCVREHRRTAVFLRAMDAAIRAARERFPGETIHVVEAGCGPLAPLALAFAVRYPAEEVSFTLLDLHPESLDAARRLAAELGVAASVRRGVAGDAAAVRFAGEDRPHVIGCEVLLRALTKEPQVVLTRWLAPQLRPGGFFLPERIDVEAALLHWGRLQARSRGEDPDGPAIEELGRVFRLEAAAVAALVQRPDGRLQAAAVEVPPHDPARWSLRLLTRIRVFREHRLGDFDSSLNLPERVRGAAALAAGGRAEFAYEIAANPGLRLEFVDGAARAESSVRGDAGRTSPAETGPARARIARHVETLRSPGASEEDRRAAVQDWYDWARGILGDWLDEETTGSPGSAKKTGTRFPTGKAIAADVAARCLRDHRRTAVFLRAVEAAVQEALTRFPGETIIVAEAGCGPLAPLALGCALVHAPERVQFVLIDAHAVALAAARRLAAALGLEASVRRYVCADAAEHRLADADRPHVIACEVLQRALADEPQVRVTRNLAPQLRSGGVFVPARIEVRLGLLDAAAHFTRPAGAPAEAADRNRGVRDLGRVCALEALCSGAPVPRDAPLEAGIVTVPPHDRRREALHLFTRIELHGAHRLEAFDTALTVPEPLAAPAELAARGGAAAFRYVVGREPGLRADFTVTKTPDTCSEGG